MYLHSTEISVPVMPFTKYLEILNQTDPKKIWMGDDYDRLRNTIYSSTPPADCMDCFYCNILDVNNEESHIKINYPIRGCNLQNRN